VAHGLGLVAGVLWRRQGWPMPPVLGWAFTFLFVMLCWVLFRAVSFEAATIIYKGLFGLADWGTGFKWRAIALAASVAIIGPTAWDMVQKMPPRRIVAVAFGLMLALVLFKIGDDANYEFIYFQF
jgi:alginate O-acetyltransferase complex protein AlgI